MSEKNNKPSSKEPPENPGQGNPPWSEEETLDEERRESEATAGLPGGGQAAKPGHSHR